MAHHQDAVKRIKQSEKARMRNRHYRSMLRNQVKKVRSAVASGDKEAASAELRKATSVIQRIVAKGVIHKNQGSRRVSRLNRSVRILVRGA